MPAPFRDFPRLACFVGLFAAMYAALAASWSRGLARVVIDDLTVCPAAWLARALTGDAHITADGSRLAAPDASVNVLFGCEGSDALMLLCAAVLAAPARSMRKLAGIACGAALVFAANQARLLSLFLALRMRPGWFGALHGLLGPVALVAAALAFYFLWLRWALAADGRRVRAG